MAETGDQTPSQPPKSYAAGVKIMVDAVQTTFGMAVMIMFFFGLSLVGLAFGTANLSEGLRAGLMWAHLILMFVIICGVVSLRLWRPTGLTGPPVPKTEDVTISGSKMS